MQSDNPVARDLERATTVGRGNRVLSFFRATVAPFIQDRRWLCLMLVCAGIWTAELFYMQHRTLVSVSELGGRFALFAPFGRLLLDLLFCFGLIFCLPRWMLFLTFPIATFCYLGLCTYADYFEQPISVLTIFYQSNEGALVSGFALQMIPTWPLRWFLLALLVKLVLLFLVRRPKISWKAWSITALTFCGLFFAVTAFINHHDPLDRILTKRGPGRLGISRGYLGVWFAQWWYLTDDAVLKDALIRKQQKSDRLQTEAYPEGDFPVGKHLVVIQCESLDWRLLEHVANGQPVTPFLNELRSRSMVYRIEALHHNGTADADFGTLNGCPPSRHVITYNIPKYPYDDTLPQWVRPFGFQCRALHGYHGNFYNRRYAFKKMGFDELIFQEECEGVYSLKPSTMGILDRDLLRVSANLLKKDDAANVHAFQFIISLSTHGPFDMIAPEDRLIFPDHPTLAQNYLNSVRYLDGCLKQWYQDLPEDTTVFLYGDNAADVSEGDFHPDKQKTLVNGEEKLLEFVPCLIFTKGRDLSGCQISRDKPYAKSGELSLLDLVTYLRKQVKKSYAVPVGQVPGT